MTLLSVIYKSEVNLFRGGGVTGAYAGGGGPPPDFQNLERKSTVSLTNVE